MKVIYMQETIDFIHSTSPKELLEVEKLGTPERKVLMDDKGNERGTYYVFNLEKDGE